MLRFAGLVQKRLIAMTAAVGFTAVCGAAQAITVSENGADYTVYVAPTANSLVWRFAYVVDFDGFTNSTAQAAITGINFKVSGADATAATLISAPALNLSDWTTNVDSNLNSSTQGCDAPQGNNNFVCSGITAVSNAFTLPTNTDAIYTWVIDVTFTAALTNALITDAQNPIRAQFVRDNEGNLQYSQMSRNGPFVPGVPPVPPSEIPEPGTLALLGLALAGIGFARRRS